MAWYPTSPPVAGDIEWVTTLGTPPRGMSFWVVSDLNAVELRQFQEKYSARTAF